MVIDGGNYGGGCQDSYLDLLGFREIYIGIHEMNRDY
jgi:hypothetical protein